MSKLQVSYLDLAGRVRRRPEPERGEPARRGRRAAPRLGGSAGRLARSHGKQGGEVNESTRILEEARENVGAGVMGRNMFGPLGGGAWGDEQWTGWWGDDPPYHYPVFILTHHPRDPVEMEGGTTFHFVTDGIESALEQAREAAGGKDVMLWGGGQRRSAVPGSGTAGRARAPRRSGVARRRCSHLRQPRGRGGAARAGPGRRGARRHAPQVQGGDINRVAANLATANAG